MAKQTHLSATIFRLRASAYAVASSLVLAASPLVAQGAGLGKVTVLSALGQPLRAEVEVFATREELAGMKAQLASQDSFKQAGVDFAPSLNGISFTLSKRANGQTIIKLSSDRPVNDPFVDLLLEVNWATGRLLREYTFLLDPPEFAARIAAPAPAVAKPIVSARPPQEDTLAPADRPARGERYRARPPAPLQRPIDSAGGYEVKRGETLSQIAGALRPDGVSLDQMLVGLFRANEGAFDRGNINRLKAGRILAVPDKAALEAIPREEARKVVLAQSSDWGGYRQRLAGTAADAPVFDEMPRQQAAGRVTTRVEDKAAPYADSKDQLKVSRTDVSAAKPPSTAKRADEELIAKEKALKDANERLATLERNVAELQRLVELKSRSLAELEKQSGNKAPAPVDTGKPAADATAVPAVSTPATPNPVAPTGKTEPSPAVPPPVLAKPADQSVAQPADVKPAETTVASPTVPPEAAKPAEPPKPPEPPPKPKIIPPPPPPDEPGFFSELLGSTSFLAGAGGVIALLGAYWFARRRRETASDRSFEPSSTLTPQSDNLVANSVFRSTGGQSVDTSHSMAQTDFSQAGPGSIDTDEVDPVAEADVYMAYGRDAQAEEILLEAKQKDPRRYAIHLKLLEIYLGRKDVKPFDALAVELFSATGGQGPDWEKVAAMGAQIDSQNPMFAGAGQAGPVDSAMGGGETTLIVRPGGIQDTVTRPGELSRIAEAAAAADTERTMVVPSGEEKTRLEPTDLADLDFDLGSSNTQLPIREDVVDPSLEKTMAYPNPARGEALDFDLGASMPSGALPPVAPVEATVSPDDMYPPEITMLVAPPPPPVVAPSAGGLDFEFDLGADWSATTGTDTQTGAAAEPDQAHDLGSPNGEALDFDVKLTESTVLGQAMQRPSFDLSSLSLDLDEVDVPSKSVATATGPQQALESSFEEEQEDTLVNAGFAIEHADTLVNPEIGTQSDLAEELEISSSEEVSTKIDLAKAYQEMGDLEGARELLQEVLKDGDAAQRRTAQTLLAGLRE